MRAIVSLNDYGTSKQRVAGVDPRFGTRCFTSKILVAVEKCGECVEEAMASRLI